MSLFDHHLHLRRKQNQLMTKYEIALNDASTDTVEANTYEFASTWVIFYGENGAPTNSYPVARVERIAVVPKPRGSATTRIHIDTPLSDAAIAAVTKRLIKDSAQWGVV